MYQERDTWTLSIFQNHDANATLLRNNKVVFSTLEERLTACKHDHGIFWLLDQVSKHTQRLDRIIFSATYPIFDAYPKVFGIRKDNITDVIASRGLINFDHNGDITDTDIRPFENFHHLVHGSGAFKKSGFDDALCVVIDGSGSGMYRQELIDLIIQGEYKDINDKHLDFIFRKEITEINEAESIFHFNKNAEKPIKILRKQFGTRHDINEIRATIKDAPLFVDETMNKFIDTSEYDVVITPNLGIGKIYEAAASLLKYDAYGVGKVMGLSCYGSIDSNFPKIFIENHDRDDIPYVNANIGKAIYPHIKPLINRQLFMDIDFTVTSEKLSRNKKIIDFTRQVQEETQNQTLRLILEGLKKTDAKKVVVSGGYFMNVITNSFLRKELNALNIEYYVDPIPNDSGMSIGALGLLDLIENNKYDYKLTQHTYHGIDLGYTHSDITEIVENQEEFSIQDTTPEEIVELLCDQNIVAIYQGRSESSARALGNRSILFDPRVPNGKDIVNTVKMRESYRPFAGTILQDHAHEWFDMLDMEESPYMMYALDVNPEKKESIPAIVHVDDTCRIQTLTREYNPHFYDLILTFYEATGVPILMNTSFNLSGDPIVETLNDALSSLSRSKMRYLYLPEFSKLIHKV